MATGTQTETPIGQAPALVSEYLNAYPEWTSDELEQRARTLARRAERSYPINRTPRVMAAAAIYLAGLLVNEKLTQAEVCEASGVSEPAIREGYIELCEHEDGLTHPRNREDGEDSDARSATFVSRARQWVGGRLLRNG